jgi:hypothetical protein
VPDEPGVGLEQVRMTPLDKNAPVQRGAGASPGTLHDSGPAPASIARFSRDSITMRSGEARGGFLVFRRFNGLLLGRPLRRGHIGALRFHRRKGFHFRQGIVRGGISQGGEEARICAAAPGKGSSRADEGPAKRFRTSNSDEDCRANLWGDPDRSSPNQEPSGLPMSRIGLRRAALRVTFESAKSAGSAQR